MDDDFLKPPSFGMWMLAIVSGGGLASAFLGGPSIAIAGWLWLVGAFIAAWVISRWLGRAIGFLARDMAENARIGWHEGIENARRERAEREMRDRS